jgi:hypothetical protein
LNEEGLATGLPLSPMALEILKPDATEVQMEDGMSTLDAMQAAYRAAVEKWIAAIREEEALASVNHSIADVDKWEGAHFREDDIRAQVKAAKKEYEDALRRKFYGF